MRSLLVKLGLLALCIAVSLWFAAADAARLNERAHWPSTTATVVESSVRDRGQGSGARYCPYVLYRYAVAGVLYDSTQVRSDRDLGQCSTDPGPAQQIIRPYVAGRSVPVYYDPVEPSRAMLERHRSSWLDTYPKIGIVATFMALVLVMRQVLVSLPAWVFVAAVVALLGAWTVILLANRSH